MTTARDRLIAYAASTRTLTADSLDPLIDDVIAEALTVGDPLNLPRPALDALELVGNKALGDYYHEDLCNCDGWPDNCTSYKGGWWDTSAFAIALPAILAAWQEMR